LAERIAAWSITPPVFIGLAMLSIFGFAWLWLKSTGAHAGWLLLIVLSWDVTALLYGGNAESLLLFLALLAAWLLWQRLALWAAPVIAVIGLIKPYYALFFVAFALLQMANDPASRRILLRSSALAGGLALALIGLEILRWDSALRAVAFDYFLHATDYLWFNLPVAEQTPKSAWNRVPLQTFVTFGMPVASAQALALALWLVLLGGALCLVYRRKLDFPIIFALAFVLLYWVRPIGWTFSYLEIIVLTVAWSTLAGWHKPILLAATAALMFSHWQAITLTREGAGLFLLTLQSAAFPWETWVVLILGSYLVGRAVVLTGRAEAMNSPASATAQK